MGRKLTLFTAFVLGSSLWIPPATGRDSFGLAQKSLGAKTDFQQLYRSLQRAHFNLFARVTKAQYDSLYHQMLAEMRPISAEQLAKEFQRFVAFGKIAHARIDANYANFAAFKAAGGKSFPLLIKTADGRTYVSENRSGLSEVFPGDELTSLNGKPIAYWVTRCGRNLSADTPYMASALMELDFPMLLWLELGPQETFIITVRHAGRRRTIRLAARDDAAMKAAAHAQAPVLHLDGHQRIVRVMDGGHIGYLRPGAFYNVEGKPGQEYDNSAFRKFVDSAFKRFIAARASSVIIDIRDNPGGDSSFSDLVLAWFANRPFKFASSLKIRVSPEAIASNNERLKAAPGDPNDISHQYAALYATTRVGHITAFPVKEASPRPEPRFHGKVYLLINRNSYSNCVAVAATVQDYSLGKVVGEETSDLATTYGAMETFSLRSSGLKVGFPKAYIVRPNGDEKPRGVIPDIRIPTKVVEDPGDPVLQTAVALARQEQ